MNASATAIADNDRDARSVDERGGGIDASAPGAAADALQALDDPLEIARFTRWVSDAAGRRSGESSLQLSGMHCAACAGLIESALQSVPGVRWARVAAASQRATVCWDPAHTSPAQWIAAVHRAGYGAAPDAVAPARELRRHEARQALWRLFVAAFCAMQVMMLATPGYVATDGDLAPDLHRLLDWGSWLLSLPVLVFSAAPFFSGAWRALRARRIGMDLPVALGIAAMFLASTGAVFDRGGIFGHEVYFDSMTMFVAFLLGARFIEMRARHAAAETLESGVARMPEVVERVDEDGRVHSVSVLRLARGDRVRVALGQAVPADGLLLSPATACDETLLSGESLPVAKREGDTLVAGSINVGAPALMRVHRAGGDTRLAAIVEMMRSAATQRPALARLADRWAGPFLWAVLGLAALAAAAWSVIDPARAWWVAVSVLIVTCPCALSLAAPAVLVAAARALARRGVLVQRLDAIATLAQAGRVFFDKTGTLSAESPALGAVVLTAAGRRELGDETSARALAAALAQWSTHPLSRALQAAASAAPTPGWHDLREHAGLGVSAFDEAGREWRLGSSAWATGGREATAARVWLAVDGEPCAGFAFDEPLRAGAAAAVAALRDAGLRVTLLSGDTQAAAQALASRVGIDDVVAPATPERKLGVVRAAQADGESVVMVGDGINDAPVLAAADVSLAMGHGALIARSQADAVLASGRLGDIVHALRIARRAVRIVHQNLAWAAAYNAVCVPLALAGWLPPWAAGLGMASSSLVVVLNALRASQAA